MSTLVRSAECLNGPSGWMGHREGWVLVHGIEHPTSPLAWNVAETR
jgi:hypothetical protein